MTNMMYCSCSNTCRVELDKEMYKHHSRADYQ